MGLYCFDQIIKRSGTDCLKWDSARNPNTLPMWVADMDFAVAPEISKALKARLEHPIFGYANTAPPYYDALCDWMERRYRYRPLSEWFSYSPGVVPALYFICNGFLSPGDKVLINTPVYHPFFEAAEKNGIEVVTSALQLHDGRYEIDFGDFETKATDPDVKLFILCNPHNPGGRMWSKEELLRLGNICLLNGVLIVSDEIHADLVYKHHGNTHITLPSLSDEIANNSITCLAPSKTFNLAGLQISAILMPSDEIRAKYDSFRSKIGINRPNVFGIAGALAAYRCGEPWLEELLDYLGGNLDFLRQWLSANLPEVCIMEPDATYLVWLDFSGINAEPQELHGILLNEGNVWLDEGYKFGAEGSGFERINIACPRSVLEEGLRRIKFALEKSKLG